MLFKLKIIIVLVLLHVSYVYCSEGDRSPFYKTCVTKCLNANCTEDGEFTQDAAKDTCRVLYWGCEDECRYHCMWKTVQGFIKYGHHIPQFHGKWPFTRVACVQEPASAFASLLNLLAHVYMLFQIKSKFSIADTPLLVFWYIFIGICIHAWTWSVIFHTRDKFFTEFMDYSCALSMVMALLVASIVRVFHSRRRLMAMILMPIFLYYVKHVQYLYSGLIDYEFNINVNMVVGIISSTIWLWWSFISDVTDYSWRLRVFYLLSGSALGLELLEFSPIFGWDSHALWHLATAPLPLLLYRFVIDDLYFLQSSMRTKVS